MSWREKQGERNKRKNIEKGIRDTTVGVKGRESKEEEMMKLVVFLLWVSLIT